jgi:hypothetical protein
MMDNSLKDPCFKIAIQAYFNKDSEVQHLKLLEQTPCGYCWRPLKIRSRWPGPRESQRPPFGNGRFLFASLCGHTFHGSCATKATNCKVCFAPIKGLSPVHFKEPSIAQHLEPNDQKQTQTDYQVYEKHSAEKYILEEVVRTLDKLSGDVDKLCQQLCAMPLNRWK